MKSRHLTKTFSICLLLSGLTGCAELVVDDFSYKDSNQIIIDRPIGDQVDLTIRNKGDRNAGEFNTGLYISSDAVITKADTPLTDGSKTISSLARNDTVAVSFASSASVPAAVPPGPAYLGVIVDDDNDILEYSNSNNTAQLPVEILAPSVPRTQSFDFVIDGENSVPFQLFSALDEGAIEATIEWTGASTDLTVQLTGRRRPGLADPTAPYAEVTGTSPLTINYVVTNDDLRRGVAWRLVIRDTTGNWNAKGTIRLTVPFNTGLNNRFQQEKIALRGAELWPSAHLTSQFLGSLPASSSGKHGIVTMQKALLCVNNHYLRNKGVLRQSYLTNRNAYSFVNKDVNLAETELAGLIRTVTPLEPEDKIDPHILLGNYSRYQVLINSDTPGNNVLNADGSLELSVLFARDATRAAIEGILRIEAVSFDPISDNVWRVTLNPAKLTRLAAYDLVEFIDIGPAPAMYDNNQTRALINVDPVQNVNINAAANTITYNGLSGNGVTAGVQDTGLDNTHADLNVIATIAPNPLGSHGTHVAGILAGSGVQSNQNNAAGNPNGGAAFQWRGMAPRASLIGSGDLDNTANLLTGIQTNSLDLVNRSQSVSYDGNYSAENQIVDASIRGGSTSGGTSVPRKPHIYSAGNHGTVPGNQRPVAPAPAVAPPVGTNVTFNFGQTGYFSITKQMKNTLIIGNWDLGNADLAAGSSLGPTYDGRIKPDLVAPGTAVTSTGTVGDNVCINLGTNLSNGYTACGGTSMSSPAVAGSSALLLEGWQTTYNAPLAATLDANPPLPSTIRALLIQTANDIVNANVRTVASNEVDPDNVQGNANDGTGNVTATAGPDYATGWGMVDAQAAVNLLQDSRTEGGVVIPNRIVQDAVNQGRTNEYDFVVNQAGALRVTLAWDDVEATPALIATNPTLVNDLDLELVAPDGTVYYPWQLGHTILDAAGNPLANNAQPPGTNIQVQVAIPPINNPQYIWQACTPPTVGCRNNWLAIGPGNNDYIQQDAIDGDGVNDVWVATTGKDHLNNVEQVFFDVPNNPAMFGHWKARVIGFNVQTDLQDYSLVGQPYPDLPDLVASSDDKVGLPAFDTPVTFDWDVANIGPVGTGAAFNYQIYLSQDFYLDAGDVALADTHATAANPLGPLASGVSVNRNSTITITQANAAALLGDPAATFQDLVDRDVFLLVRVDSGDTILEHNETNVAFINLARVVDVVVVMDRSGSMTGDVTVTGGTQTKLQILQDSANLFLDLLRQDAGDRLGLVSFATNSSINFDDGSDQVTNFGAGNIGAARIAVDNLVASGSTNIRGALQDALDMIPAGDTRRKVVVFLSDGKKTAGGDPTEAAFLQQFDDEDVKVFSVGFGTEGGSGYAGIDLDLLQTLSNVGDNGFFHVTESAVDLDKFFVNALAGAVEAEVIVDPISDIATDSTQAVNVAVTEQDSIVTFILTWDNPAHNLNLSLRTPSGYIINNANMASFGDRVSLITAPAYKLLQVQMPITVGANENHAGVWKMMIRNPGGSTAHYSASAIAESTIHAATSLPAPDSGSFNPGDTVSIQSNVRQITGSVSGAVVTVTPNVPLLALGNLLASAGLREAEVSAIPPTINGEPLSQQERMVMAWRLRYGGNPYPRADALPFVLRESSAAGSFSGAYKLAGIPGPYTFTTRVEGVTDECSPIVREAVHTVSASSAVHIPSTDVTVVRDPTGVYTVTVTPQDVAGNYIGPGFVDDIFVATTGMNPIGTVKDLLNGSYVQRLSVSEAGPAIIQVTALKAVLPAITLDTGAPDIIDITPGGGVTGSTTVVTITVGTGGSVAGITDVSLVSGNISVPLDDYSVDEKQNSIRVNVPTGLDPGLYYFQLNTKQGVAALSTTATFNISSDGTQLPRNLQILTQDIQAMFEYPAVKGEYPLANILRYFHDLPTGEALTRQKKQEAADELMRLIAEGVVIPKKSQFTQVLKAIELARKDAR